MVDEYSEAALFVDPDGWDVVQVVAYHHIEGEQIKVKSVITLLHCQQSPSHQSTDDDSLSCMDGSVEDISSKLTSLRSCEGRHMQEAMEGCPQGHTGGKAKRFVLEESVREH